MFVKPVGSLKILDPRTRMPIPAEGAEVPEESYWLRRISDGDVKVVAPIPDSTKKG